MSNLQPNCCLKFDFQKVDQMKSSQTDLLWYFSNKAKVKYVVWQCCFRTYISCRVLMHNVSHTEATYGVLFTNICQIAGRRLIVHFITIVLSCVIALGTQGKWDDTEAFIFFQT